MSETVKLDVGGTIFKTSKSTLTKFNGFFKTMLECDIELKIDESGCIFIDRSPKHFDLILNFMRDGDVELPKKENELKDLKTEAEYYFLDGLIELCKMKMIPVTKSDSQLLQMLFTLQKDLLIIYYRVSGDNWYFPSDFNAHEFMEKYSHRFDIYFQQQATREWSAKILLKLYYFYDEFPSAYNLHKDRTATFSELLETYIGKYDERIKQIERERAFKLELQQ